MGQVSTYQIEQPLPDIDSGLADQIINMLSETKKKQQAGARVQQSVPSAPMIKDWQDDLYYDNPFLINGAFWTAVVFIVQHLIVCMLTFDFWGQGDWYFIALSTGQVICAVYTMLISWLPVGDALFWVYQFWPMFYLIFFVELILLVLVLLGGLYGNAEADQFSQYSISQNIIAGATIDGIPYLMLVLLTVCVYNTRYYAYAGKINDFRTQMDQYPWPSST